MSGTTEITEKKRSAALPAVLGVCGAVLAFYLGFAAWLHFDGRFPFRTTLNGHDVSLQRAQDVQRACMDDYYPNMRFEIEARGALPYEVTPLSFDFSAAAEAADFLPSNPLTWPLSLFRDSDYATGDGMAIDKLAQRIESEYAAFRADRWEQPENAYFVYDEASEGFEPVAETSGTSIDAEKFEEVLERHILHENGDLDLSTSGVYLPAEIPLYSPLLADCRKELERFAAARVVYEESGISATFSASALLPYVRVDRDTLAVSCDMEAAAADGVFDRFAAELEETFVFPDAVRDFVTHDGSVVAVTEKTWREKLDPAATAAALAGLSFEDFLTEDGTLEGTLVWERPALDALKSYVEIDLTNQQLYLYTDGALVLESPIVSGCVAQRHTTPGGAFSLIGRYRNVTLRGPDYASFVRYWMPFNRGIGMHDASWRSRFGGTIYRTNGSHGCINLPRDAAETIFSTIDKSYAVVCYWRPAQ